MTKSVPLHVVEKRYSIEKKHVLYYMG